MAKYSKCLNSSCFFTGIDKNYCEIHHIFYGNPNRKLSEKYGMKVYIVPSRHRCTKESVHMNRTNDLILKRYGQIRFMEMYPELDFISIFGKNYL